MLVAIVSQRRDIESTCRETIGGKAHRTLLLGIGAHLIACWLENVVTPDTGKVEGVCLVS